MDSSRFVHAYNLIKNSQDILVAIHDNPDGDAIASACLLAEVLELNKKKFTLFCYSQINYQFNFLPHWEKFNPPAGGQIGKFSFDLIIVLDCGSVKRTKLEKEIIGRLPGQLVLEIDHHPKVENYADFEVRDPAAAATTEILYEFVKANKIKLNKNIANCVLTGIMTDTGNFLYSSTSPRTINIASEMLRAGARLPQIMENTWRNKSLKSMKVWGKAMSNLAINKKYNVAFTVLQAADLPPDISEEDLEGISGFLSNLDKVSALVLLREQKNGEIKGSLRTAKSHIDLSKLAQILGGGGHARAAGFTFTGRLEKTEKGWKII